MRRALLLLALSAPALASAGAITAVAPDDLVVNIAECDSATATVRLQWTATFETGSFTSGVYRVFATNKAPPTTGARFCAPEDPTNNVFVAQIGADIAALGVTQSEDRLTGELAPAANLSCVVGQALQSFYVCVHFFPDSDPSAATAWATATFQLDLRQPDPPTGLSSSPGDGALNVAWTAPSGGDVDAANYRVEATPSLGGATTTVETNSTSVRVGNLTNGVQYDVRVWSISAAENDSATAAALVGTTTDPSRTPSPVSDFWDYYGGVEQGGCSGGAAGPIALLGVAGLLAALRRRK